MSPKEKSSKKSIIIISICFTLVIALAGGLFAMQYIRLMDEKSAVQSQLAKTESERNAVSSENAVNQSKINDLNKTVSDLESKVNQLNNDISQIKLTKAAESALRAASSNSLAMLEAPNVGDKVCYLTFDDGPSDNTLKILSILKKADAKATFFVVGTSKLSYIQKAKEAGHTVALHTDTHVFSNIYNNEEAYFSDLEAIHKKVTDIIGEIPLILRFPGGSSNKVSMDYNSGIMTRLAKQVEEKGYTYVDWNVNSGDADAHNVPAKKILNQVMASSKNKNEICVLMHDTDAKNTTVEALPHVISYLRKEGFRFEALTKESAIFHHNINN